jgi:hypothetical protein
MKEPTVITWVWSNINTKFNFKRNAK